MRANCPLRVRWQKNTFPCAAIPNQLSDRRVFHMKILFPIGLFFTAALVHAEPFKATITEQTKLEVTRGKGSIVLKAGTVVEVVSKDGENLGVVYRNITGFVPAAKTDFKGEVPVGAPVTAKPESISKTSPEVKSAPVAKAADPKPSEAKPAVPAPREDPTTNYGKMVKKARDNEAQHKANLVDPVDETVGSRKN